MLATTPWDTLEPEDIRVLTETLVMSLTKTEQSSLGCLMCISFSMNTAKVKNRFWLHPLQAGKPHY